MQQTVLEAHPQAPLSVFVVWVPLLAADSFEEAQKVAALISDARAVHYYDGARWIGRVIAASVGGVDAAAWDTYLFYRPGAAWAEAPPPPDRWMHQLGPSVWADPSRFRWAETLTTELHTAAVELLQTVDAP